MPTQKQNDPPGHLSLGEQAQRDALSDEEREEVEKEDEEAAKGTYTVLSRINRNGEMMERGEAISFGPDEGAHVQQLLADGAIVEGSPRSKAAKEAIQEREDLLALRRRQAEGV